jgi:hypothetical protein
MAQVDPSQAQFPQAGDRAGHYESYYLKANHPSEPLAVWIRYTVHKRRGHRPRGSLWFTLFDASAPEPRATKWTTEKLGSGDGDYIRIGDAAFGPHHVAGGVGEISWDLTLGGGEGPLHHLPRDWMYGAPLPRTKLLSPQPDVAVDGTVRAGESELRLEGWRGMVGHNWGAEHAERWIWLHGARFGRERTWLDVGLGRIKIGPWTTPWIANGVLCLDGQRHVLGGLGATKRTEVRETPDRCEVVLPGDGLTVQGVIGSERKNFVGWVYADPDGSEHNTVNCSISDMTLTVSRPGEGSIELSCPAAAAYELGMRERDHGMAIQPFPDG